MIEIRVSRSPGERRVALLRGGVLDGYRVERPARPDGVGDILRGRVSAVAPALAAALIEPPTWSQLRELPPAFLAPADEVLR